MRDSTPGRQLRPSYGKNIITGQTDGKDTAGPEDTLSIGGEDVAPLRKGNNGNSAVVGSGRGRGRPRPEKQHHRRQKQTPSRIISSTITIIRPAFDIHPPGRYVNPGLTGSFVNWISSDGSTTRLACTSSALEILSRRIGLICRSCHSRGA